MESFTEKNERAGVRAPGLRLRFPELGDLYERDLQVATLRSTTPAPRDKESQDPLRAVAELGQACP